MSIHLIDYVTIRCYDFKQLGLMEVCYVIIILQTFAIISLATIGGHSHGERLDIAKTKSKINNVQLVVDLRSSYQAKVPPSHGTCHC